MKEPGCRGEDAGEGGEGRKRGREGGEREKSVSE